MLVKFDQDWAGRPERMVTPRVWSQRVCPKYVKHNLICIVSVGNPIINPNPFTTVFGTKFNLAKNIAWARS